MIGGLGQELQDLGVAAGIERCIGDDLLEQALFHQAGAGVGQQHATRRQQLERQHVDVLVAAAGAQQLGLALGKLGRIQHDDVKLLALLAVFTQQLEHVVTDKLGVAGIQPVQLGVLAGDVQRILGEIHVDHLLGAALEGINAKTTGVAEAVEHPLAFGVLGGGLTVVTLIQIEAGLVTVADVHQDLDAAILLDHHRLVRGLTMDDAGALFQPFLLAHRHVGALIDAALGVESAQRLGDQLTLELGAGGENLAHQKIGVAVDGQARQTVGLGGAQTIAGEALTLDERITGLLGVFETTDEEVEIDGLILVEGPDPGADLGAAGPGATGEPLAVMGEDLDGIAVNGVALNPLDPLGEDPGVATQQGFFAAFDEIDGSAHGSCQMVKRKGATF